MTLAELIKLEEHKVRNNESLMLFYIEQFQEVFGRKPNCAGCTFSKDWKRLKQAIQNNQKPRVMKNKNVTFELNRNQLDKIFTYKVENKPVRTYGSKMSEEFANNYLTIGTKKQLEDRKKSFKTLPSSLSEEPLKIEVEGEEILLSKATGAQLDEYAKQNDIDFEEATKVADKKEVIAKTL